MTKAEWERVLESEGLAPLDCEDRGSTVVSSRGTVKVADAERLSEREAEREQRSAIAATRRPRHAWERRALALYADGVGVKRLAATLSKPRRKILNLLAREPREPREPRLIAQKCDTGVLMRLLEVLG